MPTHSGGRYTVNRPQHSTLWTDLLQDCYGACPLPTGRVPHERRAAGRLPTTRLRFGTGLVGQSGFLTTGPADPDVVAERVT